MNAIATEAVNEFREVIGVSRAAALFGLSRSSFYYQPVPEDQYRQRGGGSQPNALGEHERSDILEVLHSKVHVDQTPYDVYASLCLTRAGIWPLYGVSSGSWRNKVRRLVERTGGD